MDTGGNPLPLYKQVWNLDPLTGATSALREGHRVADGAEESHRPGASGDLGHGYTGNKLDPCSTAASSPATA